jgi:DNA-binding NarL/FixJ family response regulator
LTVAESSIYLDRVSVNLDESRRLMDAATSSDPEVGLTAVVALRQLVEVLEELQVGNARARGWSWRDIARRLGVTKQAVHYKHGLRLRGEAQE